VGAHLAPPKIAKALKAGALGTEASYLVIKSVFRSDQLDPILSESFKAELGTVGEQPDFAGLFQRSQNLDPLNRYLIADLSTWLPEDLLMKVDKMSMSVGLEARAPFLDHRIVELLAAMPSILKWYGGGKYLLKRVASGFVAEEIIRRPKHGFVLPLDRWFRIELREMATEALLGPRATQRGFFDYRNVQRLWDRYLAGDSERFMQIWTLLNFEIWCRVFLDGDRGP
jgi:asparagine synthase (glutamine-hydrolysing)